MAEVNVFELDTASFDSPSNESKQTDQSSALPSEVEMAVIKQEADKARQERLTTDEEKIDDVGLDLVTDETQDLTKPQEPSIVDEVKDSTQQESEKIEEAPVQSETQVHEPEKKEISNVVTEVRPNQEQLEAQNSLQTYAKEMVKLDRVYAKQPTPPADPEDERAMLRYQDKLDDWKDACKDVEMEKAELRNELVKSAEKYQQGFIKNHPEMTVADKTDFSNWIKSSEFYYTGWVTGHTPLEDLYQLYSVKTGKHRPNMTKDVSGTTTDVSAVANNTTQTVKKSTPAVSVKQSGISSSSGNGKNGLPAKFEYANKPELREFVADYKEYFSPLKGRKLTNQEIETLCEQEFKLAKKQSITK
jgi:hypothetical protein